MRAAGTGTGWPGQHPQHAQGRRRGRDGTAHASIVSYPRLMWRAVRLPEQGSARSPMETWTVVVDVGPLSPDDVVRVAREGAQRDDRVRGPRGDRPGAQARRRPGRVRHPRLRGLDRVRRAGQPAHRARAAHAAAEEPDPFARRRHRPARRGRGGARADAAAPLDHVHRPHRRPAHDRRGVRGPAQRRPLAGRPRARQPRLLRRPRAARALRARGDGRGRGRRRVASCAPPPRRSPTTGSSRSSWPRRRASPSSTAPTACSACSCSPSPTCDDCSTRPTSRPRSASRG